MYIPKAHSKIKPKTLEAWLVSDESHDKRLAMESLQRMSGEEQKTFYKNLLRKENDALYPPKRHRLIFFVAAVDGLLVIVTSQFNPEMLPSVLVAGIFLLVCAATISLHRSHPLSKLQQLAGQHFAEQASLEEFPELLRFMSVNAALSTLLRPTFLRLLQTMTPESREAIPAESWDALGSLLTTPQKDLPFPVDAEMKQAILHGIGKAGKERMRPVLETVANTPAKTPEVEAEPVRQQIAGR